MQRRASKYGSDALKQSEKCSEAVYGELEPTSDELHESACDLADRVGAKHPRRDLSAKQTRAYMMCLRSRLGNANMAKKRGSA